MSTGTKKIVSSIIDDILVSLGVLKTLDEGTVPTGLKFSFTIKISKNCSGKSLFSRK